MKRKIWTVSPILYILAVMLGVMTFLILGYNKVFFAVGAVATFISLVSIATSEIIFRQNIRSGVKIAKKVLIGEDVQTFEEFALGVVAAGKFGDIIWANTAFKERFCPDSEFMGENVLKFIFPKTLRQIMNPAGAAITYADKEFTVYGVRTKEGFLLYFYDDTFFKSIHRQFRERQPVIGLAVFDNRDELVRDGMSGEESRITAEVDAVIRSWVIQKMGGVYKKIDGGRYFFITDESHIDQAKSLRFGVLDDAREVKNDRNISATISMGLGRGASNIAESERMASQAIEMALGRGGDQVAVMHDGGVFEFFGGRSKGVEKRDKVRTRVIAATLADHVESSDKVFIMGHKNSDLDVIGAAVGMWAAFGKGEDAKQTRIVIDKGTTLAPELVAEVEGAYPKESIFITPQEAMQSVTEKSMLIVVDTHSVNFVESRELLDKGIKTVVIDHHRMMVTHIKDAVIFYHEPYASSASEMVTELVQYIKSSSIETIEAQALLAGIMLDTKNFVLKTGVRTFEASAFLRRRGADTVEVKRLFSNTLGMYKLKSHLVSGAEIYRGCAIACSSFETEGIRVASSQAADELLSIKGVSASFVLYRVGDGISISARSLGDVNVQIILEALGGGGHFTMAGAHIPAVNISDARKALMKEIDTKLTSAGDRFM